MTKEKSTTIRLSEITKLELDEQVLKLKMPKASYEEIIKELMIIAEKYELLEERFKLQQE